MTGYYLGAWGPRSLRLNSALEAHLATVSGKPLLWGIFYFIVFSNTKQECAKPHMRSKSKQINFQHPAITITGVIKISCLKLLKLHREFILPKHLCRQSQSYLKVHWKSVVQATWNQIWFEICLDGKKLIQPSSRPTVVWDALYYRNRGLLQINKMQLLKLEFDQDIHLNNFYWKKYYCF